MMTDASFRDHLATLARCQRIRATHAACHADRLHWTREAARFEALAMLAHFDPAAARARYAGPVSAAHPGQG